ncbi:MAG: hypothetical protein A2173_07555 [Planctomycetes bacterium RBG_13_44_8b]|nr:MAG: hypothetical protein A2173_07555 [Planctomycetes bacterium RBG_13_44_8b]
MKDLKCDIRIYLRPEFLICVAVLAIAGGGMSIAVKRFGVYLKKEPLLLKKSLDLLDEKQFAPYRVVEKRKILNEEIVEELGTEDYIQWVIEDTREAAESSVRRCIMFVTYYRLPDRVPHVPEECYAGSGYQRFSSDSVTFEIKENGSIKKIPGKYLVFGDIKSSFLQGSRSFPVIYLFKVNDEYAGSRDEARIALNKNLFNNHSYFSKIELVFNQTFVTPNKEQAVAASEKLLSVILPILEQEHWPEW